MSSRRSVPVVREDSAALLGKKLVKYLVTYLVITVGVILMTDADAHQPDAHQLQLSRLQTTWVHSHEEDLGDQMVYRPADFDLPPSRGRTVITFAAEGVVEVGYPGPDDRGAVAAGRWTFEDGELTIDSPALSGVFEVEAIEEDRLVLRRLGEEK